MLRGGYLVLCALLLLGTALAGCIGEVPSSDEPEPDQGLDEDKQTDPEPEETEDEKDEERKDRSEADHMPPKAVITVVNETLASNTTLYFNASKSLDPQAFQLSYSWEFDNGTTASGREVGHVFEAPGRYNVTLNATSEGGLWNTTVQEIKVDEPKPVSTYPEFAIARSGELSEHCPGTFPYSFATTLPAGLEQDLDTYETLCNAPFDYEVFTVSGVPAVPEAGTLTFTVQHGAPSTFFIAAFDGEGNFLDSSSRLCQLSDESLELELSVSPEAPRDTYQVFISYNCAVTGDGPAGFPLSYTLGANLKKA